MPCGNMVNTCINMKTFLLFLNLFQNIIDYWKQKIATIYCGAYNTCQSKVITQSLRRGNGGILW